ncbi:penicillin-binding transpeptidase domain-containing protein, partial [Acinetobacter baumannii]|nr:penicillin-binding transpeptidase domain-containing protein [Acinetobacter baumannii]
TSETLDQFKDTYDEFAWTVAMAPKDDPKIAVACVIPQGVTGGNAAPTVREIIGQYLKEVAPEYADGDFKIVNEVN